MDAPFPLVDHIVISPIEYHWQTGSVAYDPRLSNQIVSPMYNNLDATIPLEHPKEYERVIARRVALEFINLFKKKRAPVLVNLGIGIPALISSIAAEENIMNAIITGY